jgi:DNA modification methylase
LSITIVQGNCFDMLSKMSDGSFDCCVTSPPYYRTRKYGLEKEVGQEKTPDLYVKNLCSLFDEVRRVLSAQGTFWLSIGDCRSNGSLLGIPWAVASEMRSRGWFVKSEVTWAKPNPIPESAKNRPTSSHEVIFLMTKEKSGYFYNYDRVKEKSVTASRVGSPIVLATRKPRASETHSRHRSRVIGGQSMQRSPDGMRRLRDVWTIPTSPFKGTHFAVMPVKVAQMCVMAGCPVGGIVLDPFSGSGTTGIASFMSGSRSVLVEANPEYVHLSMNRVRTSTGVAPDMMTGWVG